MGAEHVASAPAPKSLGDRISYVTSVFSHWNSTLMKAAPQRTQLPRQRVQSLQRPVLPLLLRALPLALVPVVAPADGMDVKEEHAQRRHRNSLTLIWLTTLMAAQMLAVLPLQPPMEPLLLRLPPTEARLSCRTRSCKAIEAIL